MSRMYPKQAVDIVNHLLKRHRKDPSRDALNRLSQRQIEAITFLANFVDEVRQARDLVRVVERLFEEGILYTVESPPASHAAVQQPETCTQPIRRNPQS